MHIRRMRIAAIAWLSLSLAPSPLHAGGQDQEPKSDLNSLSLEELLEIQVDGAALHAQSLEEAPASVTIITRDDIRKFGYHTLAEALTDARGFFTTYDHIYHFQGVRGFGLPGDYGTRLLLLVNGHNLTDNLLGQSVWFGQDFPLDMNLIKRIELIRGPASALYGSNGLFATINVVTLSPDEVKTAQVHAETGSLGEKKIQGSVPFKLGQHSHGIVSASILRDEGEHSIYVPEYDSPDTNFGRAVNVDGERGYHVFGNLTWRDWNFSALLGGREKTQVISWGPTVFNDPTTRSSDVPNFIDASYARNYSSSRSVHWRTYYDSYRFRATFRYQNGIDAQLFSGDWAGSQLEYRFGVPHFGALTLGAVSQFDLRAMMRAEDLTPTYKVESKIDKRDRFAGVFAQHEWAPANHWKLNLGTRFDYSHHRRGFVSPRAAAIFEPFAGASYKLLYGKAFRNPTAFELFYTDLDAQTIGNPDARPEASHTVEFVAEQKLTRRLNGILSVYRYGIDDLLVGEYTDAGNLQYHNANTVRASGVEMEVNGRPTSWLELVGSLTIQHAESQRDHAALPNSPHRLAKFRAAVPLLSQRLTLAGSTHYIAPRETLTGASVPSVWTSDLVVSSNVLTLNTDFQVGLRNIGNAKLLNPLALNSRVDTLASPGRSLFFSFTWRVR